MLVVVEECLTYGSRLCLHHHGHQSRLIMPCILYHPQTYREGDLYCETKERERVEILALQETFALKPINGHG